MDPHPLFRDFIRASLQHQELKTQKTTTQAAKRPTLKAVPSPKKAAASK